MTEAEFDLQLKNAAARITEMDTLDGGERSLHSIIAALQCGLRGEDIGPAFDAMVMLADVRASIEKRPILHSMCMRALYEALDAGCRVSAPQSIIVPQ